MYFSHSIIVSLKRMRFAIDFDYQHNIARIEIGDIMANYILPSKLYSLKSFCA